MASKIKPPQPLSLSHELNSFSCGEPILDSWLLKRAWKNEQSGASRTYVVCVGKRVVAYYSLAVGSISHELTPGKIKRNMPDPVPVMVLARLAVDTQYQGQGIAMALLRDALLRTIGAAGIAGIRALLVHALNENAASFYQNAGLIVSPFDPLVYLLPLQGLLE